MNSEASFSQDNYEDAFEEDLGSDKRLCDREPDIKDEADYSNMSSVNDFILSIANGK
jgi:hypothetical protein